MEYTLDAGQTEDELHKFKSIQYHRGPYSPSYLEYLGCCYNLLIEWEAGEMTWEPLTSIIADDPYSCAVYAKIFDLLYTQGWKQLKRHPRTARRLITTLKRSKYRQAQASKRYKNGWEVPTDYAHALQLDVQDGNTKWKDAIDLEISSDKRIPSFQGSWKGYTRKGQDNQCTIRPQKD